MDGVIVGSVPSMVKTCWMSSCRPAMLIPATRLGTGAYSEQVCHVTPLSMLVCTASVGNVLLVEATPGASEDTGAGATQSISDVCGMLRLLSERAGARCEPLIS